MNEPRMIHNYQTDSRYLHTVQAGAWLPLLQSTITGGLGGLLLFVLAVKLRWRDAWLHALIFWLIVQALAWLYLQRHWFLLTLERLTGRDINQDGRIAENPVKPEIPEIRVKLDQISKDGHFSQDTYQIPATLEQMEKLARGVLEQNISFGERNWTGSGNPFSVSEFRTLRSELIRRGLLILASGKDARQGYLFTAKGRAVLRGFIGDDSPSPLEWPEEV